MDDQASVREGLGRRQDSIAITRTFEWRRSFIEEHAHISSTKTTTSHHKRKGRIKLRYSRKQEDDTEKQEQSHKVNTPDVFHEAE